MHWRNQPESGRASTWCPQSFYPGRRVVHSPNASRCIGCRATSKSPLAPVREITHKAATVYTYRLHILDLGLGELRERLLYSASSALALHGIFRGTALTLGNLLVLQTPQAVFVKLAAKRILLTGRIALPGKHRLAEITQDPGCIRSTTIVRLRRPLTLQATRSSSVC
jgi:hypothetical protein